VNPFVAEDVDGEFRTPIVQFEGNEMKEGNMAEHELPDRIVGSVSTRDDISGCTLVKLQGTNLVYDGRDDLNGTDFEQKARRD
jgi:hypothetical protein